MQREDVGRRLQFGDGDESNLWGSTMSWLTRGDKGKPRESWRINVPGRSGLETSLMWGKDTGEAFDELLSSCPIDVEVHCGNVGLVTHV